MTRPSRVFSCSFVGLLLSIPQVHIVDASEPHFVDLNVDNTAPTFRFASETTLSGNLRASTTTSSGQRPSFPTSHQNHRHLAKVADWRPWPDDYINDVEIIHNLCDDEWISAVERASQAWTDRSGAVGLRVTASQCNKKVNDDLTFIPGKIHVVYGTCGSDCCGKANVEYSWRGDGTITKYQALVRLDPDCFSGSWLEGKQYLACHEIGHAIGLGHNNDDDSCLGPYNSRNGQVLNYGPGKDDIRLLDEVLYADAVIAGGGNARPAPTPVLIQPKPTTGGNIFAGSETLVEVKDGDCDTEECGKCQGDCDSDSQCKLGLKCFFRGDSRAVPGCMGEGIRGKDYCYDPTFVATSQRDPSPTNPPPTNPPPTNPPPTNPPPTSPNLQFATLKRVSNRNCGKRQCKKCEGDCDGDKDCQKGLKCFYRKRNNPWEPIPGCQGSGEKGRDYCYDPNDYFILQQGRGGG
mmetsp:Transcript_24525/g.70698  ORF Transcript_24525/g.70698 Transcript_24525/m.70698 type:complete len:463 (+) Transcript_24525:212-1600(+)